MSAGIPRGFSVLCVVLDEATIMPIPVGVVAWDRDRQWYDVRTLKANERVRQVPAELRPHIESVGRDLERWADGAAAAGAVEGDPGPVDGGFRDAAQRLTSALRMDPPLPLDPSPDPALGLEGLFDAVVRPRRTRQDGLRRIDRLVNEALEDVRGQLQPRLVIQAYRRVSEQVRRVATGPRGLVIVEALNLAGHLARQETDALVSRILRIRAGPERNVRFVVGYLSSPGRLNGEDHLRAWIRSKATGEVYDLNTERDTFRERTRQLVREIGCGRRS